MTVRFTMFSKTGVQVAIEAQPQIIECDGDDCMETLVDAFFRTAGEFKEKGFDFSLPGLKPGERTARIEGWVLTQKDDGEPVVDLYHATDKLKYPLRLWQEHIRYIEKNGVCRGTNELHFNPFDAKQAPAGYAGKEGKAKAKTSGFWNNCDFEVVMGGRRSEPDADGNTFPKDFMRVHGISPLTGPGHSEPATSNGQTNDDEVDF